MPYLLSLDEGTTSARAAVYDEGARRLALEAAPIECRFPEPGWVEQDAEAIWEAQLETARRALARCGVAPSQLAGLGITNQRETVVLWDRRIGRPIAPAIVWQCRRTAEFCTRLAASESGERIARRTGLVIDAYFSASKIAWLLGHVPDARARARNGDLLFGNIDSWLIWKLTGGAAHVTDASNASRTLLMNLVSGDWDEELLGFFDIPRLMLPRIVPSSGVAGVCRAEWLNAEVPIAGIAGDQQSALVGQACFEPGLTKNTYGTGCFALMHTGGAPAFSGRKLLATRAAAVGAAAEYALEGSVFVAGAAVQWLRDQMGLLRTAAESEEVARQVPDTGGVYFVPAFVGLGAPYWQPDARGLITGLTRATTRAHLVRAALESIAYQTWELIAAMEADAGQPLTELRVDGGAAANDFLAQFQADILDRPVVRPQDTETTALGAAYLAGLATRVWRDAAEIQGFWRRERVFEPQMGAGKRALLREGWKQAVTRAQLSGSP